MPRAKPGTRRSATRKSAPRKRSAKAASEDSLSAYRAKRDFARTPEPDGAAAAAPGNDLRFVIQKHAATRLHYDLRLELDGVFKSWAVTKGPSLDPAERRLAMRTEDHPLDYGDFEGLIPKGEYGGGAVIVWDRGTWVPMADPHESLAKGVLKFRLSGEKLGGGWSVVKLKKRSADDQGWLLVKERDVFAASDEDVLETAPDSVLSGRSVAAVQASGDAKDRARHALPKAAQLTGARRATLAAAPPRPQLASAAQAPPSGPGWLHEIKYDGYRTLCRIEAGTARLFTRNGLDWTKRYGPLAKQLAMLPCKQAIIDGEVAVTTADGRTSFAALQDVLEAGPADRLVFFAFDLLHLDGHDLSKVILIERKAALAGLLAHAPAETENLVYSDHVIGRGADFLAHALQMELEGIVSKKIDAPYEHGRSARWLKIKASTTETVTIVGYTESEAAGGLAALLVAEPRNGTLAYAGKVGTGFTAEGARRLVAKLKRLKRKTPPLAVPPDALKGPRPARVTWVTPRLRAEVTYRGRGSSGMLRAAAFKGLTDDVAPPEHATMPRAAADPPAPAPASQKPKRPTRAISDADLATIWITNPDRRMFGRDGPTKLDLALYYARVADWILPHIADRPVTLVRCPTGEAKDCFYQRHLSAGMPESVSPIQLREEGEAKRADYLYIRDAKGLLGLAQFGVIEFHPWGCRVDKPERPDRLVFDLDPDERLAWPAVTDAARALRNALQAAGFTAYVKTTGGKGLHVVVPVRRTTRWRTLKSFARGFVQAIAADAPTRYTTNPKKAERRGRIYLDYLRNTRGATAIAPYALRARTGVPVALPLAWEALDDVAPAALTVATVPALLADADDPWWNIDETARPITRDVLKKFGVNK